MVVITFTVFSLSESVELQNYINMLAKNILSKYGKIKKTLLLNLLFCLHLHMAKPKRDLQFCHTYSTLNLQSLSVNINDSTNSVIKSNRCLKHNALIKPRNTSLWNCYTCTCVRSCDRRRSRKLCGFTKQAGHPVHCPVIQSSEILKKIQTFQSSTFAK